MERIAYKVVGRSEPGHHQRLARAPGASNSNRPVTPLDLKKGRGREGEFLNPERPEALGEDLSLGAVALGREVRSVSDSSQLS